MTIKDQVLEALNYVGVAPKDFNLKDDDFTSVEMAHHRKHGMPHLYRVMIAAALIAKELGEPRKGLLALCAAFLHDMARVSNGSPQDKDHGYYAAMNCFGKYEAIWQKYNLTDLERDYVRAACSHHSSGRRHTFRYDSVVSAILTDADALDRCRFYCHGRLVPEMLKFQTVSRSLIPLTEEVCRPTNKQIDEAISFTEFINLI